MQPDQDTPPALLVVVPRHEPEVHRQLQQRLEPAGARVILDRRATNGTPVADPRHPERRREERRARDATLASGRWIAVAGNASRLDVLDADGRAILFLYCSQHAVPCERCQDTYRLGWLARTDQALRCPRCGDDLTAIAAAHTVRCTYWAQWRTRVAKPPARIGGQAAPIRSASA